MKKSDNRYKSGEIEVSSGCFGSNTKFTPKDVMELSFYKVYRDGNPIGTTTDTVFTDYNYPGFSLYYMYYVTAVYDSIYESAPSNSDTAYFATGISEHQDRSLIIFPNPVSDIVNINSESIIESVKLFSTTGKLLLENRPRTNDFIIDISNNDAGVYLLRIETEKEVITRRIIKK